jgi:hypothetical protein
MHEIEVRLIADADDLERDLRSMADIPDLPLEVRDSLIDALSGASEALRIDCENASAGRAGDLRVSIKLNDFMRDFVAALRARNFDRVVVDEGHVSKRSSISESR